MATIYAIINTRGEYKFSIQPKTYDGPSGFQNHTDLKLSGEGYSGWGDDFNLNYYKLLENFACPHKVGDIHVPQDENDLNIGGAGINKPVVGQMWFNVTTNKLHVNSNAGWKEIIDSDTFSTISTTVDGLELNTTSLTNDVADLKIEFENLVTTSTGGDTPLNSSSNTQQRDAINVMIDRKITQALINANVNSIAPGTTMIFYQASAPITWTRINTPSLHGAALHIVTDSSGGTLGNTATGHNIATGCNVVAAHTHTYSGTSASENAQHVHLFTTGIESATHTHQIGPNEFIMNPVTGNVATSSDGANGLGKFGNSGAQSANHTHSGTTGVENAVHAHNYSGITANNTNLDTWRPLYANIIVCVKN